MSIAETDDQNATSQVVERGKLISSWDTVGFWLMVAGAAVGVLALLLGLTSSIILYRVTQDQQTELADASRTLQKQINADKVQIKTLERDTANAKLATEQLKERLQWRDLTEEEDKELTRAFTHLKARYPTLNIYIFAYFDPEAANYGEQIAGAIERAGYATSGRPAVLFRQIGRDERPQRGIFVSNDPPEAAIALQQALRAGGVNSELKTLVKNTGARLVGPELMIEVWRKPVPKEAAAP